MAKKNWIIGILSTFLFFLIDFFSEGANNSGEAIQKLKDHINILGQNPFYIIGAISFGLLTGAIFWIIDFARENKGNSNQQWILRSIIAFVAILLFIYLVINITDMLIN